MLSRPAPAARDGGDVLRRQLEQTAGNPVVDSLLQAAGGLFAILNEQRQILAINNRFLDFLGIDDPASVHGLRVGEAVGCVRAEAGPGGCGTGTACQSCGAVVAMVISQVDDAPSEGTCCLQYGRGEAVEEAFLQVRAVPMRIDAHKLILLFMQDATREQERALLERSFVHDISNILGVITGLGDCFDLSRDQGQRVGYAEGIRSSALRLAREVSLHRCLLNGGDPSTYLHIEEIEPHRHLQELLAEYRGTRLGDERELALMADGTRVVRSDPVLLDRVLGNLILNALEASDPGGIVRIRARMEDGDLLIEVWNAGVIPPPIQARIFQRNFSSKARSGRGLGTFMAKRIAEHLLGGQLSFRSATGDGTTFTLLLPSYPSTPG